LAELVAFINENIWEINQFPRLGYRYNLFTIKDIFFYNSLEDITFEHQNKNACIQIPESLIEGINDTIRYSPLTKESISVKDFVLKHKDHIIKNKFPIIRKEMKDGKEVWICDLNMMLFDDKRDWQNVSL
jgi:hypothetical protein